VLETLHSFLPSLHCTSLIFVQYDPYSCFSYETWKHKICPLQMVSSHWEGSPMGWGCAL
jgi:hypothetical protein